MEANAAAAAAKEEQKEGVNAPGAADATAKSDAQVQQQQQQQPSQPQPVKAEDIPDPDEDVPDPDEDFPDDDDLDDLDDELDQFISPPKIPQAAPAPPKPVTGPPKPSADVAKGKEAGEEGAEGAMSDEDFAKDFSNEMRKLMQELDDSPEMQKQLDEMFASIQKAAEAEAGSPGGLGARDAPLTSSRPGTSASSSAPRASFKDTIAGLNEQLKNSDKTTKDNIASGVGGLGAGSPEEALLSQLLQNLPMGGLGGGEGAAEDDFTSMLMGMMEQLTAKEILYDPMKELAQGFPAWMEKNKEKVPAEQMAKHGEQLKLVNEIVAKFEEPGYSDEDGERRKYIVDRMQEMQATGAIPPDLLGESASMQEAFSADGGCNPQ